MLKYKCPHCDKYFTQLGSRGRHVQSIHEVKLRFKCDRCEKKFTTNAYLQDHVLIYHTNRKRSYFCNSCEKSFFRKYDLNLHEDTVHKGIKRFKCEMCSQCFAQKGVLDRHVQSLHDTMIQNFSKDEDKGQKLIFEFDHSDCLAFLTSPWTIRKPLLASL